MVPCHRVVPAAGGIGQYRWGAERKAGLLEAERGSGSPARAAACRSAAPVGRRGAARRLDAVRQPACRAECATAPPCLLRPPAAECASPDDTHTVWRLALARAAPRERPPILRSRRGSRYPSSSSEGADRRRHGVCLCRGRPPGRPAGSRSHRAWRQCHGVGDHPADAGRGHGGDGGPARPACWPRPVWTAWRRAALELAATVRRLNIRTGFTPADGLVWAQTPDAAKTARTRAGGTTSGRARRDLAHAVALWPASVSTVRAAFAPGAMRRRPGEVVRGLRAGGCRAWRGALRAHACA